MSSRWAYCSLVCIALLGLSLGGCGVFDKANPPPNPILQIHGDTIKAWTDDWCAVSDPHPIVLRIKDAVAPSEIDTTLPISQTECNQIATRILTTKKLELVKEIADAEGDSGLEVLGLFTNLETLILVNQNIVNEELPKLEPLTALTYLDLSANPDLRSLGDIAARHPRLKHLRFNLTGLEDTSLNLEKLSDLTVLEMEFNPLMDKLPKLPPNLQKLAAGDCNIFTTDGVLKSVPSLLEVDLSGNQLMEAPEVGPRVARLDISRNDNLKSSDEFRKLKQQSTEKKLSADLYVRVGPLDGAVTTDNLISQLKKLFENKVRFGKGEKSL